MSLLSLLGKKRCTAVELTMSSSNPNICSIRFSIQWVKTARWTLAMLTLCEKFDGKVVERSCFCNAEFDGMEAVPLMLGMVMVGIGD